MNLQGSPLAQGLVWLMLAGCIGCSSSSDSEFVKSSNDSNIKKITSAYQLYASRFRYIGPKSKDELINFLKSDSSISKNLEMMEIDPNKVEEYFISDNDGKEFAIRWGVFINPDQDRSKEPLVFETEGLNGVRLVMLSNRKILEVKDSEKYNSLLRGKVDSEDGLSDLEREEDAEGDPNAGTQ